jgi:hypothetical protein
VKNFKNIGLALLAALSFTLPQVGLVNSANAAVVRAAGKTGVCTGNVPNGGVDCIYPAAANTSYNYLYVLEHTGGSGADFWICNATAGYTAPTSISAGGSGCVFKKLGPGWESSFRNPFALTTAVDIYINVHNNGQSTSFRLS